MQRLREDDVSCRRFGGADMLLIEEKGSGIDVVNEMKRLYGNETWAIEGIVPLRDKVSRPLSVQPVFSQGLVHAPLRDWSDMVKSEMALFPKGPIQRFDGQCNAGSQVDGVR
jgi:predicted phage terminase large subunit-like protein